MMTYGQAWKQLEKLMKRAGATAMSLKYDRGAYGGSPVIVVQAYLGGGAVCSGALKHASTFAQALELMRQHVDSPPPEPMPRVSTEDPAPEEPDVPVEDGQERCEGCRKVFELEDMRLTNDTCWLCRECWDNLDAEG